MENNDFTIPRDFATECKVVAELVANPDFIPVAMSVINAETFYDEKCKDAYSVLVKMFEAREPIDLTTVSRRVDHEFFFSKIVPLDSYALEPSVRAHCEVLRSVSRKRRLFFSCMKGLQLSESAANNDDEILAFASRISDEMEKDPTSDTTQSIGQAINELGETLASGVTKRVPTGFPSLDRLTYGGWAEGDLIVLAARPSVGKTAVMLQMTRAAARSGVPVLALSLEMTNAQLAKRMMFSTGEVNPADIAYNRIDWDRFEHAAKEFDSMPIYLDESPQTLDEVCSIITRNVYAGKCKAAYIDYLQLMSSSDNSDSLYRQVTEMTKRLKKLAKKLKIPVILLAQLNRNSVSEKRAPQLHDLRDSGSIEQDADGVLMLERLVDENQQLTDKVNMYVRKYREGLAGDIVIKLQSSKSYTTFYEITDEIPDQGF